MSPTVRGCTWLNVGHKICLPFFGPWDLSVIVRFTTTVMNSYRICMYVCVRVCIYMYIYFSFPLLNLNNLLLYMIFACTDISIMGLLLL